MNDGYLGNQHLKRSGVPIEWTQDMLKEYMKCAEDPVYFAKNYIKIVHVDKGLVPFEMYPYQEEISEKIHKSRRVAVLTARQSGKALSLDTKIPSPDGWKTMGMLEVGDTIFDGSGEKTKVSFVTDTMYDHDVYEIEFDNGEKVKADAEHLWAFEINHGRSIEKFVETTENMIGIFEKAKINKKSVRIKNHNGVEYSHKDLKIHPYVLGLWLGDGNKRDARINTSSKDLVEIVDLLDSLGYETGQFIRDCRVEFGGRFKINDLYKHLREENILNNKHIPQNYIFSSKKQRIELIQGLMDSYGNCDSKKGSCEFYQKDENLIDDFRVILSSLGVKSRKRKRNISGETYYTVSFSSSKYNFFKLSRKRKNQELLLNHDKNDYFYIKEINAIESVPVRCIQVDNDEHLFLCSESFIPTHNTTTAVAIILHYILFNEFKTVAILANKGDSAREVLSRVQLAYEALPKWLQQGILEWNKGSIELENGCKIYAGTTSSSAIRGKSISFLYLDEVAFIEGYDEFFASVYPTISSGESTKLLMTSTPNGLNHFYKTCKGAEEGTNGYEYVKVMWHDVPGRDDKWKEETLAALDYDEQKFAQEYCCVVGNTNVTVRDKDTGEIKTMSIKELYDQI